MEISNPQYQINMGCHQVEEIMLLAPNNKTSSSCSQETKKGGGGVRPQGQGGQAQLTCPRCESTNTKFCYYNNYSLSQPRYFCKSCRRYWTQGGSLRNVPVGGGCRKNTKRSSSSSSSSKILINNNNSNNNNNNSIINRPLVDHTLVPTSSNPNINPLQLLTLHDPTFLLPPNPNPNLIDILRGSANGFSSGLPNYGTSAGVDGGVGGTEGQQWQFGNNGRNVNVAVDMGTGNIVRDYNYNYNNWNDMNGAASSYWNGVINSSLM